MLLIILTLGFVYSVTGACPSGGTQTDGAGVHISGKVIACKYLQQQLSDDIYDVYTSRVQICKQQSTDCCKTCEDILTCQDQRLYLAESYYDCKFLRKRYAADRSVGIYNNRHRLCKMTHVQCCESCKIVANEIVEPTTKSPSPTQRPPVKTQSPAPPKIYEDTCTSDCLWIADGLSGSCDWLTNSSFGVYNNRLNICRQGFAPGCKRTCHNIIMESKTNRQAVNSSTQACVDKHLMVDKNSLDCSALQDPSSHVYSRRKILCKSSDTYCCQTCKKVTQEQPNISGNPNAFNSKEAPAGTAARQYSVQQAQNAIHSFVHIYSLFIQKAKAAEREKKERQQQFGRIIKNMFSSMFKQLRLFKRRSKSE